MGFFSAFMGASKDINAGVQECKETQGARLVDVRTPGEYNSGHIPGSVNIPSDNVKKIESVISKKDTPLYVYCLSGGRATGAVSAFKKMGYTNVQNIGGIQNFNGQIVMR